MAKKTKIESLRRLIHQGETFLKESKVLLETLEAGEEVESPSPTLSKKEKTKALISDLLSTGRRVKKRDIQGL